MVFKNPRKIRFYSVIAIAAIAFIVIILHINKAPSKIHSTDDLNKATPKYYSAEDFHIKPINSTVDFNKNGIDDYHDILAGAHSDAEKEPRYDGSYFVGGYPPNDAGVCTDVIWRAFKQAGYNLKDMVDQDIQKNTKEYPSVNGKPDPNIDFRRVPNLKTYFQRHAVILTTDPAQIGEWQPGDIVVFGKNHIGILSDRRNRKGIPWLIHNAGQPMREEDALTKQGTISGHFRFDATKLSESDLIRFSEE